MIICLFRDFRADKPLQLVVVKWQSLSMSRLAITPEGLTLAELHVSVLTSFIKFDKALTKFNEALAKPYHSLIEILL